MASWYPARQLQRNDRYVHSCHLRGGAEVSRTRLQFFIEEALRLTSLPGENEGRTYYFRKVTVTGISPRAGRQEWISALQTVLLDLSFRSIHGGDPRAADADVVFFQNHQEALEVLLAKTLRANSADAWFWPQVIGSAEHTSRAAKVLAIIQRLSTLPASWLAVADSVFAAIGSGDPLALLTMLPPSTVHGWMLEMGPEDITRDHPRPVYLQQSMAGMLLRSVQALGSADPRVVWLTALAVMQAAPSELNGGAVVGRARTTLHLLAERAQITFQRPVPGHSPHSSSGSGTSHSAAGSDSQLHPEGSVPRKEVRFTDLEKLAAHDDTFTISLPGTSQTKILKMEFPSHDNPLDSAPPAARHPELQGPADTWNDLRIEDATREPISAMFSYRESLSETTEAAGLLFLLNALTRLHIAEILARNSIAVEHGLVARIIQQLALHAGVEERDPVWRWISSISSQIPTAETPFLAGVELFPPNLPLRSGKPVDMQYLVRAWCIAVRRWCWHFGRITVGEVVNRQGFFSVNRGDVDVTLPLNSVELRIRRAGLDLDPGWLPWLGNVVRFHYV